MEIIELASRALLASESGGEKAWDDLDAITRGAFRRDATAVLQAIREPSEAMLTAGALPADIGRLGAEETWQTMIDAALQESNNSGT